MKDFDLEPHNWKSEREKPHEPIFGPGWPVGAGIAASIVVTALLADGTILMKFIGPIIGAVAMGIITAIYL